MKNSDKCPHIFSSGARDKRRPYEIFSARQRPFRWLWGNNLIFSRPTSPSSRLLLVLGVECPSCSASRWINLGKRDGRDGYQLGLEGWTDRSSVGLLRDHFFCWMEIFWFWKKGLFLLDWWYLEPSPICTYVRTWWNNGCQWQFFLEMVFFW